MRPPCGRKTAGAGCSSLICPPPRGDSPGRRSSWPPTRATSACSTSSCGGGRGRAPAGTPPPWSRTSGRRSSASSLDGCCWTLTSQWRARASSGASGRRFPPPPRKTRRFPCPHCEWRTVSWWRCICRSEPGSWAMRSLRATSASAPPFPVPRWLWRNTGFRRGKTGCIWSIQCK